MFGIDGSEILIIALLILGLLAMLMPIFVYQIRNKVLDMDKKMGVIIDLNV